MLASLRDGPKTTGQIGQEIAKLADHHAKAGHAEGLYGVGSAKGERGFGSGRAVVGDGPVKVIFVYA